MSDRPSICMVADEYPPDAGGVGQSVARIARALHASDYDVTVIVLRDEASEVMPPVQGRPRVLRFAYEPGPDEQRTPRDAERFARLLRFCRSRRFDLFHSFFPTTTGLVAGLLARLLGVPFLASFRGNDLHHGPFGRQLQTILWVLQRADLVTFVNGELRDLAEALVPGEGNRVVVPNAFPPVSVLECGEDRRFGILFSDATVPCEKRECQSGDPRRTPKHPPVVGMTGVFRAKKGLRTLLAGCSLLRRRRDFRLLLVGDFAPSERAWWAGRFPPPDLAELIHVTGLVPHAEVNGYLRQMDVFVHPALYDGCPNGVLEAAALGLPIVCSRTPATCEMLADGVECLMHEPEDPADFARCVERVLADAPLRLALASAARARAARFTNRHEAEAWGALYRRLLRREVAA